MKKKIIFFLIIYLTASIENLYPNDIYHTIQPEVSSKKKLKTKLRYGKFKSFVVVTANDYATKLGYEILEKGGTAVDAAVVIQLALGLVEPQSSGIGGGLFITYFDSKTKEVLSYEGREKAPQNLKDEIFLDNEGNPKKFFDAAIGGAAVGVPGTLKTLYKIHKDYGSLKWDEIIKPVIKLSTNGFIPPNRLINALKKEKFLFKVYPDSIFRKISENPKENFLNDEYTKTLKKIARNPNDFYTNEIAHNIIETVRNSKNPGLITLKDLKDYETTKNKALCYRLDNGFKICGPNLPSSGTICSIQALILFENLFNKSQIDLNEILSILNFIYYLRDLELADDEFVYINKSYLFNKKKLFDNYRNFKKNKNIVSIKNLEQVFNSTTHFSVIDKNGNALSATSSIESSFGSRLFTNGFFLNNQLTDFDFQKTNTLGKLNKNRPQGGKKPLSSMAPLLIFDEKDNFVLSVGSPGGKAIISYVLKSLIHVLFQNKSIKEAIESPNYVRIKNKTFIEHEKLKKYIKHETVKRNLTSGISIIKKEEDYYSAGTDSRRDGTVRGK